MNPFATVSKPLGQKSPKSPLTERKEQLDSASLPCTPLHRPPQTCPTAVPPAKNERFPFNIRDTVDWIIGRSRRKADLNKENRNNVNTGPLTHNKKTGVVSASHSSTNKTRKAPSSETCVADSFDNAMLDKLTEIPYAVDRNEWLATHVLALFEHVNALCGAVSEHCTPGNCPNMNYPGCTKASWTDERGKRHQFSAPRYIDCVMSFSEGTRSNEVIFPTKYGSPFPADFEQHCRRMVKLLWHCCGHLYAKHWDIMHVLNLRPQTALVLAHMASIARLYNLLEPKELTSLTNTLHLVRPLCLQAPPAKRSGGVVENIDQDDAWSRVPTSKSGSWGGHSAVSTNPGVAQSQTC